MLVRSPALVVIFCISLTSFDWFTRSAIFFCYKIVFFFFSCIGKENKTGPCTSCRNIDSNNEVLLVNNTVDYDSNSNIIVDEDERVEDSILLLLLLLIVYSTLYTRYSIMHFFLSLDGNSSDGGD